MSRLRVRIRNYRRRTVISKAVGIRMRAIVEKETVANETREHPCKVPGQFYTAFRGTTNPSVNSGRSRAGTARPARLRKTRPVLLTGRSGWLVRQGRVSKARASLLTLTVPCSLSAGRSIQVPPVCENIVHAFRVRRHGSDCRSNEDRLFDGGKSVGGSNSKFESAGETRGPD